MLWINFLHIYQPVNTDAYNIKEATEKSYLRIVRALEENREIKFTININGCLFLRWEELGYQNLIERVGELIKKGQLEITGNAAYHPLLPLIPLSEAKKQILESEEIFKKHFGKDFKPKGFFFSEMAYGKEVAILIKSLGYEWTVLDEISLKGEIGNHDFSKNYFDENSGLSIIFRSRKLSNSFVPDTIQKMIENNKELAITATDGELYGLRYIDQTGKFEKLLKQEKLKTLTVSEFIKQNTEEENIAVVNSSWESSEEELKNDKPYILWQDKDKEIQNNLWDLANLAYKTIEENKHDTNYIWARWHLVRGLASCTFWWASGKDFKKSFGPLAWSPDEIERGSNELIRAIRALDNIETRDVKMKSEKMYIEIKRKIWEQHWTYYWKKNIEKKL